MDSEYFRTSHKYCCARTQIRRVNNDDQGGENHPDGAND